MAEAFYIAAPGGSLRFWGDWFGRPYDNFHRVRAAQFDREANTLTIYFETERLIVKHPAGIRNLNNAFSIRDAAALEWSWYSYGPPPGENTARSTRYTKLPGGGVQKTTQGVTTALEALAHNALDLI